jgi:hypothetical protein
MQKLTILFFCLILSYSGFSQNNSSHLVNAYINRGSYIIGGNISSAFSGYTNARPGVPTEKGSIFRANVDAKVGYFNWEDIAIGLKTSFNHYNQHNDSSMFDSKQTILLYGPFVRGYLDNGFFAEISGGWGLNNIFRNSQSNLFNGEAGIGYSFFMRNIGRQNYFLRNKQIAIEPMVLFRYNRQNFGAKTKSENYRSEYGPEFRIGIQVYIFRQTMMLPVPIKKSRM